MPARTLLSLVACALLATAAGAASAALDPAVAAPAAAAAAASTPAADPSAQQIYAAAASGQLAQARQMIDQVLRRYPQSARAHYVAAQIYARSADFDRARQELDSAQSLNPALSFATPAAVATLRNELRAGAVPSTPTAAAPHGTLSHAGPLLILIGIVLLYLLVRRRRMAAAGYGAYAGAAHPGASPYAGPYPGAGPYPQPGPYGPGPYGGGFGRGSGLMGGMTTGLAVGAGVAAGEALTQHLLGGGSSAGGVLPAASAAELPAAAPPNADMGGADFGLPDPGASWDDGSGMINGDSGDFGGGDPGGGGDWT